MLAESSVLITGVPSPGKTRLVDALQRQLRVSEIAIQVRSAGPKPEGTTLHVHAQSDVEALVEGQLPAGNAAKGAELVVPVDWEPVERSVNRVIQMLITRGIGTAEVRP